MYVKLPFFIDKEWELSPNDLLWKCVELNLPFSHTQSKRKKERKIKKIAKKKNISSQHVWLPFLCYLHSFFNKFRYSQQCCCCCSSRKSFNTYMNLFSSHFTLLVALFFLLFYSCACAALKIHENLLINYVSEICCLVFTRRSKSNWTLNFSQIHYSRRVSLKLLAKKCLKKNVMLLYSHTTQHFPFSIFSFL